MIDQEPEDWADYPIWRKPETAPAEDGIWAIVVMSAIFTIGFYLGLLIGMGPPR